MAVRITCKDCGYHRNYKTQRTAEVFHPRHSCSRERERQARARRVVKGRLSRGGIKRECEHKYARHLHGTRTAYVLDRCRCLPCLDAATAYERMCRHAHRRGRWNHRVDATAARERLLELAACGISYKQVARLTGISATTLGTLIYGRHDRRGGRPPLTMDAGCAEQILALAPDPFALSDGHRIDAAGSRRRLQALVCVGWSQRELARRLGMYEGNMNKLFEQRHVTAARARAIRELYEAGWAGPPAPETRFVAAGITRAKRHAAAQGWLPPLAWPDDCIDDPHFDPTAEDVDGLDDMAIELAMAGHQVSLTHPERREAITRLAARGHSDAEIGRRLHINGQTVCKDRLRHNIAPGIARVRRAS